MGGQAQLHGRGLFVDPLQEVTQGGSAHLLGGLYDRGEARCQPFADADPVEASDRHIARHGKPQAGEAARYVGR